MSSETTPDYGTFATSRDMDFFSEAGLAIQIGYPAPLWPAALLKELIDNALDAAEKCGVNPEITVELQPNALRVTDNGPGIPHDTVRESLDFGIRVSDKSYWVAPTRGRLGNALKCIWAAPFVADGKRGLIEIEALGNRHKIEVLVDPIEQKIQIDPQTAQSEVTTGTSVTLHWPGIASSLGSFDGVSNYLWPTVHEQLDLAHIAEALLRAYATFNPHARFCFRCGADQVTYMPGNPTWRKWRPGSPTSPHWYSVEQTQALIAAFIARSRRTHTPLSIRDFIESFSGLKGTKKRKEVFQDARLPGDWLEDLIKDEVVSAELVGQLLVAMKGAARKPQPSALGVLGEANLCAAVANHFSAEPASVHYVKKSGLLQGLPWIVEVAFGVKDGHPERNHRDVFAGVNWSPGLRMPFGVVENLLQEGRIDRHDPVVLVVHIACPGLGTTDAGKSRYELPNEISNAVREGLTKVTKEWTKAKRKAERTDQRVTGERLQRLKQGAQSKSLQIRDAAFEVMEEAYLMASANGTLPANARQIMYAARPRVLDLTGGRSWDDSRYFTQTLLPRYMQEHPQQCASWDVVFDARGHMEEPHTGCRIELGTLGVRDYMRSWSNDFDEVPALAESSDRICVPTFGPSNRFNAVLFIEKEGFESLLRAAYIAERFDVAIMSTKGMSVTAARQLVEQLSQKGATILVLHDFDKAGFSILHTLQSNTTRFQFQTPPKVIDLGLRLTDVRELNLASEAVTYSRQRKDPKLNLKESGATDEECRFLVRRYTSLNTWLGERVELNAMTSVQFVQFLERKLAAAGVAKLMPDEGTLVKAFRRATHNARGRVAMERAIRESVAAGDVPAPADLRERVWRRLRENPRDSWDEAVTQLVVP